MQPDRTLTDALQRAFQGRQLRELHSDAVNEQDSVTYTEPWGQLVDALFIAAYPREDQKPTDPATDSRPTSVQLRDAQAALSNALRCYDELQSAAGQKYQDYEAQLAKVTRERDNARAAGGAALRWSRTQRQILDRVAAHHTRLIDTEPPAYEQLPELTAKAKAASQAYLLRADHLAAVATQLVDALPDADRALAAVDTMRDVLSRDEESYLDVDYDTIGADITPETRIDLTPTGREVASVPRDAREEALGLVEMRDGFAAAGMVPSPAFVGRLRARLLAAFDAEVAGR